MTKIMEYMQQRRRVKNSTFQLLGMITIPDELGTEADKFLHQRLKRGTTEKEKSI
jgi:hypothetical protein